LGGGITPGTAAYNGGTSAIAPTATPQAAAGTYGSAAATIGNTASQTGQALSAGPSAGIMASETDLLQQLLNNPYSLGPDVIAQIKARFQDQNAIGMQQLGQQIDQSAASRGMVGSGATEAAHRRSNEAGYSALLGNNREVDIMAAQQRTQDILNALGASNEYVGREEDLQLSYADQALRKMLGLEGFAVDREGMQIQKALANADRAERMRQFNLGLGFDYTQLGANQNQNLWAALYGG